MDNKFEEMNAGKALVMFWGSWCPVCKQAEVLLEQIEKEVGTKIYRINVDKDLKMAVKYSVMGTPSFLVFENGKEIKRVVGSQSKEQIMNLLKNE